MDAKDDGSRVSPGAKGAKGDAKPDAKSLVAPLRNLALAKDPPPSAGIGVAPTAEAKKVGSRGRAVSKRVCFERTTPLC